MERSQIARGRGIPRKNIIEVVKKDIEINILDKSMVIENYRGSSSM